MCIEVSTKSHTQNVHPIYIPFYIGNFHKKQAKINMRDKEKNVKTLADLGLSRTQAKIYLALIEKGTSTIRAAADYSEVGRPDTYRAMLELKRTGLVETILGSPARYKPRPLSEAVSILIGLKQKEMFDLKEKTGELLQEYEKKIVCSENAGDNNEFILIPKGLASAKKGKAAITDAQNNVDIITSFKRFNQTLSDASEIITQAANRGVKFRFIIDSINMNKPLSKIFSNLSKDASCQIKYIPQLPQHFIALYDKSEVQMATSTDADFSQAPMLWSNNPVLVGIIQEYFDTIWFGQLQAIGSLEEKIQASLSFQP